MEVQGVIKLVREVQSLGEKGFLKRELIVETTGEYPQPIMIEFVQDKTSLLNDCSVGDSVTVAVNLRGREWTNAEGVVKYFNSIQGWKVTQDKDANPLA